MDVHQRFTKLDAAGNELPFDATGHVAVLDRYPHPDRLWRVWAVEPARARAAAWDKCDESVKAMTLLGANDWELPSVDELFALADRSTHSPAINADYFPRTKCDWYWTSTPSAYSASYAWIVNFGYGDANDLRRGNGAFARAVRRVAARQ